MPVVIPPEDYVRWLGEVETTADELAALLTPWPAERMRVWTVSPRVNSVKNNDADLLARLEAAS